MSELRPFARSRRKPVLRVVKPLHKYALMFHERLGWRILRKPARTRKVAKAIEKHWLELRTLSDTQLERHLEDNQTRAQDLLVPAEGGMAFAQVLEVIRRETGLNLRDNQIACALALLRGECVELRTGEGKTLAAALAALIAARAGVSTHVITVNDYLASRDHKLMVPLAARLNLSNAVMTSDTTDEEKQASYDVDILYSTNKIYVFDHLRDKRERRQSGEAIPRQMGQAFAIVDEADSVLIDDATTPMILSEPGDKVSDIDVELFYSLVDFARNGLEDKERLLDGQGSWRLTDQGLGALERFAPTLAHPLARSDDIVGLTEQALSAVYGFREGESFVVRDGEVVLIDQSTGRLMPDRRWSYGLHQMVEIATNLEPTPEAQTVAQITQQTYFRQYRILAGLTGTARECRPELWAIYQILVRPISSHAPTKLRGQGLQVFSLAFQKWAYVLEQAQKVAQDRSVLVGVNDVAEAQALADVFAQSGCDVAVLDALSEEQEAELVGKAGQRGAITIATHLAGRGTDILLADETRAAGGLHVMICSIMASGRLERQLYGRAGRQGDPGSYETVISLEDRGLVDGAQSSWRRMMTLWLNLRLLPRWALSQIQTNRDRRARSIRRKSLLREQELAKHIGYR